MFVSSNESKNITTDKYKINNSNKDGISKLPIKPLKTYELENLNF